MPSESPDLRIWLALRARCEGLVALTGLTIEWPNETFSAPAEGYLRVRHVPNVPMRMFQNGDDPHERRGVLQIMVRSKRGGTAVAGTDNTARAMRAAAQVAGYFPPDLPMTRDTVTVKVLQAPRVGEVVNPVGSAYAECAVEIQYRCSV